MHELGCFRHSITNVWLQFPTNAIIEPSFYLGY